MENVINGLFKSIDNFIIEKVEDFKRNKYSSFNSSSKTDYTAFICCIINHIDEKVLPNAKRAYNLNEEQIKDINKDINNIWFLNTNIYETYKKYQLISSFNKRLEPFSIRYEGNKAFGGRTRQEEEEYNEFQLKGFELYKNCNFDKELKRNINKHIAEYTKFFLNIKDKDIMTVSPMKKIYPSAYYEHCRSYKILVDNQNKSLLLLKK